MSPKPRKLAQPFFSCYERGETPDLAQAKEIAARLRNLDCTQYDRCLDLAAREHWRGFSCEGCPLWRGML